MSSNIDYLSINENFPVAGQDNDTQVFRDNFDTIKKSLNTAKTEISTLQANTQGLQLQETLDQSGSDFGKRVIFNAVLQNNRDQKSANGSVSGEILIDFINGPYQIYEAAGNITFKFLNFPGDITGEATPVGVGKVTLELYNGSDTESRTIAFSTSSGTTIYKDENFPAPFTLTTANKTNPVFVEIWRHSLDKVFLRYLGTFSS